MTLIETARKTTLLSINCLSGTDRRHSPCVTQGLSVANVNLTAIRITTSVTQVSP
jgi:hypothetical protein